MSLMRGVLQVMSWPYCAYAKVRNWAYDNAWLASTKPSGTVIVSVGNIVAGGTGKTPLICKIAQELMSTGRVGIISRGYRAEAEKLNTPTRLSRGEGPEFPANVCGDEPYLLSSRLPSAWMWVGRHRCQAAEAAASAGCRVVLLDDALQHRSLGRDFDIVMIDADDPFGQGYHLPRGLLRESPHALRRAHLVVANHVEGSLQFERLREQVAHYTAAPVVGMKPHVTAIQLLNGESVPSLTGVRVGLFCGIANPKRFHETVRGLGAHVVAEKFSADHCTIDEQALKAFTERCRDEGAELLLCTEKDKVKLPAKMELALPIGWVKIDLIIVDGHEQWDALMTRLKKRVNEEC